MARATGALFLLPRRKTLRSATRTAGRALHDPYGRKSRVYSKPSADRLHWPQTGAATMKLIGSAFLGGALLVWTPTLALADEVSKNAKIKEIMQLTHSDRMLTQVFD